MDGHQDAINMTQALEALSPYLENPRRIVIRNEAFVVVAAVMLFLQLMLGPWRRRSGHWFVQGTLWLAYTLSFPVITYTLGQMVTSPVKNVLYPVWALILFWATGSANAFMAYNIEDNKRWKRYLFEFLQYFAYITIILRLLRPPKGIGFSRPIFVSLLTLMSLVLYTNMYRVRAGWMVENSVPSKLVANYMRALVKVNTRSRAVQEETFTMDSCKYLVCYYYFLGPDNIGGVDSAITIEAIWGMAFDDDILLKKQLRDVCLSFALSHLLRRRYFEMDCAEAGLPNTLKFALECLLPEEDQVNHYSGAFHVIEVELGFLYDFFFTKHATLFSLELHFFLLVVLKLICTSITGLFLLTYPTIVNSRDPIIEVGTRRVDVTVTMVIMGALLLFEVLQAILYLTSDWATVSLACSYTRGDTCKLIPSIIRFLRRFKYDNLLGKRINYFGYWRNKMGQSSVIGGNLLVHWLNVEPKRGNMFEDFLCLAVYHLIYSTILSMKNFVVVPDLVKSNIISCLRIYSNGGGPLTNGKAALERNGVLGDLSSTLENDSQIAVMLIWHIATEYCNIASSNGAEDGLHNGAQQVATTLSKYCAYLMYFVPELLAENPTDTLFIVHDVLKKVQSALGGDKPTKDRLLRVIQDSESIRSNEDQPVVHASDGPDANATIIHIPPVSSNSNNIVHDSSSGSGTSNIIHDSSSRSNNNRTTIVQDSTTNNNEDSILIRGLKLGRDLEAKDVDLRWKVMAEFWAETIIYIAPSDKAAEHMECLAQGGEFLTHIWALLTHAGIVKRDHMIPTPDQTPSSEDRVW
ncbi:hypothetical protein CFC21_026576 [Triticum aestivum]|uniref:DUF4220 domain-containing protein n=2 Tax=Triticum aestivum TaxID=4565 RepID=A0A9R1ELI5_WHEAT|nr:hypothetical protein CFC21_026576 [Triticum aestivum]